MIVKLFCKEAKEGFRCILSGKSSLKSMYSRLAMSERSFYGNGGRVGWCQVFRVHVVSLNLIAFIISIETEVSLLALAKFMYEIKIDKPFTKIHD